MDQSWQEKMSRLSSLKIYFYSNSAILYTVEYYSFRYTKDVGRSITQFECEVVIKWGEPDASPRVAVSDLEISFATFLFSLPFSLPSKADASWKLENTSFNQHWSIGKWEEGLLFCCYSSPLRSSLSGFTWTSASVSFIALHLFVLL